MCEAKGLSQASCLQAGRSVPVNLADIRLSVRLLTRSCLYASQSWHLNAAVLVTRRIWQLLRREGLCVNHKRVYRIYQLNGLSVKRRRRRKGAGNRTSAAAPPDGAQSDSGQWISSWTHWLQVAGSVPDLRG